MDRLFEYLDLRTTLNSIVEGVTIANAEGTIVFSNEAADQLLGVPTTDAPAEGWSDYYGVFLLDEETPFPADQYPLVRALDGEETRDVEMFVRNPNRPHGAILTVSGGPIRDGDGRVAGALVVFRDVTAARAAQRMREELYAFFMHDLKSPLTSILALSQFLEGAGGELAEDLELIGASAESMHRMVMNFLDVHLSEDGALALQLEDVPVTELLQEAFTHMEGRARGAGKALVEPEPQDGMVVKADRALILRVLQNLVDNCVKYGAKDGRIWLDASPGDAGTVVIHVRDEGPGVPDELKERIFDKYAVSERDSAGRSRESRGLGLRFCTVAAEAHGGRVWVEDNDPAGAIFNVELSSSGAITKP